MDVNVKSLKSRGPRKKSKKSKTIKLLKDPKYPEHNVKISRANLKNYDPSKSGGR